MKKCALFCFILLLVLSLVGCTPSPEDVQESISQEVIDTCESYGLTDVSVAVTDGGKFEGYKCYYMSVISSNFESLSYEEMYDLDRDLQIILDSVHESKLLLLTGDYISGEDTWTVYDDTIYKNDSIIDENWDNSKTQKSSQNNKDKSYSSSTLVTDSNLKIDIWVCAKDIAKSYLKSPSSADFCSVTDASVYSNGNNNYTVNGYVNAENDYGAVVRSNFTVTLTYTGSGYKNGAATFW